MKLFLGVTFAWSWGVFFVAWIAGIVKVPFQEGDAHAVQLLVVFMFGPMVGAIVAALFHGSFLRTLRLTGRPNMWWLRAWAFPIALVVLSLAATMLLPDVKVSRPSEVVAATLSADQRAALPSSPLVLDALLLVQALVVGAMINGVVLLNEELGWRGYMLSRLSQWSFWERHLCIGLVWGLWHIPVVAAGHNYPGEPVLGPLVFTAYCMLLSPLIGYFSEKSNSVFGASIFHGTLNAAAPLSVIMVGGVGVFDRGIVGWPGIVLLILCCMWLALSRRAVKAPSA